MPGKRRITLPDGREVDVEVLGFRAGGEHWNEYLVDDGSVIKIKFVATEVMRLEGEHDAFGNPVYFVQSTNVMSVDAPENLRQGGSNP
jgi:hypothetical protein